LSGFRPEKSSNRFSPEHPNWGELSANAVNLIIRAGAKILVAKLLDGVRMPLGEVYIFGIEAENASLRGFFDKWTIIK